VARSEKRASEATGSGVKTSLETCLDEDTMLALVARRIPNLAEVEGHLDRCGECRGVLAELVRASRSSTTRIPRGRVARAPGPARVDRVPGGRSTAKDDGPTAGERVGDRFVLEREIGEGAAGVVWAARDLASGMPRALKLLHTCGVDHVRRMRREAAVLATIRHPSIVFVHEIVETARRGPVLVMDLLEGEPLEARLDGGRTLTASELAPIARGILSALSAAHARGVVHRDLKPANVFLERGERSERGEAENVRVLDFGMAKLDGGWQTEGLTPAITRSGTVMGTPLYMAPEQVFCERNIDGRADLWAFGVILHRALSGAMPVEARTFAELMKALASGRVRRFPAGGAIGDLVDRLLSIDPASRPSLEELVLFYGPQA
jgi:serine/threonine protein kinase